VTRLQPPHLAQLLGVRTQLVEGEGVEAYEGGSEAVVIVQVV